MVLNPDETIIKKALDEIVPKFAVAFQKEMHPVLDLSCALNVTVEVPIAAQRLMTSPVRPTSGPWRPWTPPKETEVFRPRPMIDERYFPPLPEMDKNPVDPTDNIRKLCRTLPERRKLRDKLLESVFNSSVDESSVDLLKALKKCRPKAEEHLTEYMNRMIRLASRGAPGEVTEHQLIECIVDGVRTDPRCSDDLYRSDNLHQLMKSLAARDAQRPIEFIRISPLHKKRRLKSNEDAVDLSICRN